MQRRNLLKKICAFTLGTEAVGQLELDYHAVIYYVFKSTHTDLGRKGKKMRKIRKGRVGGPRERASR